ncbi:MAG: tRNA pseudouridine(13) synthase TruD [Deltaproteobacteria bacterium]
MGGPEVDPGESLDLSPQPLPLRTPELPGVGGLAKMLPDDFEVEELPAYLPSGAGEHLYLWIEKRGRTTPEAADFVARELRVAGRAVSWAGLKDRQGVTRQWLSVLTPGSCPEALKGDGVRVLRAVRHGNKLRPGHLLGNRFRILIRGADDAEGARAILEQLHERGLPNWFGPQRFGRGGDNATLGLALLGRAEHPGLERAKRDRFLRRLALSALQAELFNRTVALRISEGAFDRPLDGDLLQLGLDGRGPVFVCEDPLLDGPRVSRFEVTPTGPMFGPKMRHPAREAERLEAGVLARAELSGKDLEGLGADAEGTRRPIRVRPIEPSVEASPEGLRVAFSLPRGAYATSLLREIVKPGQRPPP